MKKYVKPTIEVKEIKSTEKIASLGSWISSEENSIGLKAENITSYDVDSAS